MAADSGRHRDHLGRDRLGADTDPETGRRARPVPARTVLDEVIAQRGWQARLRGARVHVVWDRAVGPEIAEHAQPVRLHGGVLVVAASSPAWATQLRYLSGDLAERLNAALGEHLIDQVRVTVGD